MDLEKFLTLILDLDEVRKEISLDLLSQDMIARQLHDIIVELIKLYKEASAENK